MNEVCTMGAEQNLGYGAGWCTAESRTMCQEGGHHQVKVEGGSVTEDLEVPSVASFIICSKPYITSMSWNYGCYGPHVTHEKNKADTGQVT